MNGLPFRTAKNPSGSTPDTPFSLEFILEYGIRSDGTAIPVEVTAPLRSLVSGFPGSVGLLAELLLRDELFFFTSLFEDYIKEFQ